MEGKYDEKAGDAEGECWKNKRKEARKTFYTRRKYQGEYNNAQRIF